MLETYEAVFGTAAADAFLKYIRARHAGIPVAVQGSSTPFAYPDLPNSRPLQRAIDQGVFGTDECGVVSPSEEEVMAITQIHADKVIELMTDFRAASAGKGPKPSKALEDALDNYAVDFGRDAAESLRAYCQRQLLLEERPRLQPDC